MSKIDYQALREAAQNAKDLGGIKNYKRGEQAVAEFESLITPHIVLALLDERGKLRVELEAEKQRAKDLFMENARLKSGIAGLIHLGIRYADVDVMKIAGDAQLSTPCTDSIINSIATGIRIKGE
ncbi:ead/Ea22-like family protein [Escherichia coli]|nr:ead/Ea22-like family protein [Escherichia coli]